MRRFYINHNLFALGPDAHEPALYFAVWDPEGRHIEVAWPCGSQKYIGWFITIAYFVMAGYYTEPGVKKPFVLLQEADRLRSLEICCSCDYHQRFFPVPGTTQYSSATYSASKTVELSKA